MGIRMFIDPRTVKGVEELVNEFNTRGNTDGYLSCMIAILYFATVYGLQALGSSTLWKVPIREVLADYAYVVCCWDLGSPDKIPGFPNSLQFATIFWVGFAHIPGNLKSANISKIPISRAFYPTQPRGWLLDFWNLDVKWIFAALPFGFLILLLFYYDHVGAISSAPLYVELLLLTRPPHRTSAA